MWIFGDLMVGLGRVLQLVLTFLWVTILVRAILSWVNPDPYNPIVRFIYNVTEPILYQVRKRLPSQFGGFDFSPIIVFLIIIFIQEVLIYRLLLLGQALR
ncbi:MAG: YggT family protein [Desulfobacteraceae bacterium]|nr:YggT family protein [Desulfobacteraceae bacterium]